MTKRNRLLSAFKANWGVISAVSLATVVAGCAGAISFNALRVLAVSVWVPEVLSPLYPASVDGMLFVATVAAVMHRSSRLRTRFYIWTLIAGAIGISVAGNALHTTGQGGVLHLPLWAAAIASAVPPVSWAAALHLVVIVVRRPAEPPAAPVVEAVHETVAAPEKRPTALPPRRPARVTQGASNRRLTRLLRQHPDIGATEVSRKLGVSRSTATRWLSEARRPRVVTAEKAASDV